MDIKNVQKRYFEEKGREKDAARFEKIIEAVAEAIKPWWDLPATPENMWDAKWAALNAYTKVSLEGTSTVQAVLMGAVMGIGNALKGRFKDDNLALQTTEHYFLSQNSITDPEAVALVKSGQATIGRLFELQPSIYC